MSLYPHITVVFISYQGKLLFETAETSTEIHNQSQCRVVELSSNRCMCNAILPSKAQGTLQKKGWEVYMSQERKGCEMPHSRRDRTLQSWTHNYGYVHWACLAQNWHCKQSEEAEGFMGLYHTTKLLASGRIWGKNYCLPLCIQAPKESSQPMVAQKAPVKLCRSQNKRNR